MKWNKDLNLFCTFGYYFDCFVFEICLANYDRKYVMKQNKQIIAKDIE